MITVTSSDTAILVLSHPRVRTTAMNGARCGGGGGVVTKDLCDQAVTTCNHTRNFRICSKPERIVVNGFIFLTSNAMHKLNLDQQCLFSDVIVANVSVCLSVCWGSSSSSSSSSSGSHLLLVSAQCPPVRLSDGTIVDDFLSQLRDN